MSEEEGEVIELKGELVEIFKVKPIRNNFLSFLVILTSCSFIFFLINFELKNLGGSIVVNTLSSQIAECIANCFGGVINSKIGPKKSFALMFLLTITGSALFVKFYEREDLTSYFIVPSKFGVSASFNIIFIVAVQLIPTIFSSQVFGLCNVVARTVTAMSSLIAEVEQPIPMEIVIGVSTLAILFSLIIVEKLPKFKLIK